MTSKANNLASCIVLFLIFVVFGSLTYANQEYMVSPSKAVTVKVARSAINRIVFENDRISQVIGNDEQYQIEGENDTGQIFLTPKITTKNSISITIMTEKGNIQDMTLSIDDKLPAQTIILKGGEGKVAGKSNLKKAFAGSKALKSEQREDFKEQSIDAIRKIHTGQDLQGVSKKGFSDLPCLAGLGLKFKNGVKYEGQVLNIYKVEIANYLPSSIEESLFKNCLPNIVAISLQGKKIYLVQAS